MPLQEFPLAQNWHGVNRSVSPQNLAPSESPDTNDARSFDKKIGAIGPRLGRARISSRPYPLNGLGILNVPWGRFRLVSTTDGVVHPELVPWPAPVTPTSPDAGWDVIHYTATQTRASGGTATSAGKSIGSFDLSAYGQIIVAPPLNTKLVNTTGKTSGVGTETTDLEAYFELQIKLNGTWTALWRASYDDMGFQTGIQQKLVTGFATFTDVRTVLHIPPGFEGQTVTGTFNIFLVKGGSNSDTTVSEP